MTDKNRILILTKICLRCRKLRNFWHISIFLFFYFNRIFAFSYQRLMQILFSSNRSLLERRLFEQIKRIFNIDGLSILMSKLKFLSGRDVRQFCEILALFRIVCTICIILLILSIMLGCFTNLYRHRFCLHNSLRRSSITAVLRVLILI